MTKKDNSSNKKSTRCSPKCGVEFWVQYWQVRIYSRWSKNYSSSSLLSKYIWDGAVLRRKGLLVVINSKELLWDLFYYFHNGPLGGHSGIHATRNRFGSLLYWKGLTKDVKTWVEECLTCQRCKVDLVALPGLLQPLPIFLELELQLAWTSLKAFPPPKGKPPSCSWWIK